MNKEHPEVLTASNTKELYTKLSSPLPDAALKPHPTKSFLTQILPAFVIERLNEVFGIDGWHAEYEDIESHDYEQQTKDGPVIKTMIVKKCHLSVRINDIWHMIEQYGGNDNDDRGDAHKGAATDALTKCASYVGVGLYVYKGELDGKRPGRYPPRHPSGSRAALPSFSGSTPNIATTPHGRKHSTVYDLIARYITLINNEVITPAERAKGMASIERVTPEKIPAMIRFLENVIVERTAKQAAAPKDS